MGEAEEGMKPPEDGFPFFEDETGRKIALELAGIEEKDRVHVVTFRVAALTLESTVQPQPYEQLRLYARLEPEGMNVNVLVHDPAQLVNESGDVDVLAAAVRQVGRRLDMLAVELAQGRAKNAHLAADREIVARDRVKERHTARVDAGKEVVQTWGEEL